VAAAVTEDVWAEHDTTPDAIEAAMRELLRQRHAANERLAPARVLNMVVILDREWKGEIYNRLEHVGRYHASRTVLCAVEDGRKTLDAVATVSYEEPQDGVIGAMSEQVEIDLGPEHLEGLATIVDPVLVTELPTVLWSPHGHEEAVQQLLPLVDVMLIDSDDPPEPEEAFEMARRRMTDDLYLVDLAWLRTTPWRERLAASFDLADRLPCLPHLSELEVRHRGGSTASGLLLAGWLATRLHWDREPLADDGRGVLSGMARREDTHPVEVRLRTTHQEVPGLVGVTVGADDGFSLSLQRGAGGLDAEEHWVDGSTREWKILGASRGEAGILGEGIRQALLREPTYAVALRAARELCPA
jgi:glucose-6-phosphate dehydrogenase assembly protein OpcA